MAASSPGLKGRETTLSTALLKTWNSGRFSISGVVLQRLRVEKRPCSLIMKSHWASERVRNLARAQAPPGSWPAP